MSKKGFRMGKKFCGNHTTVVPTAGRIADIVVVCEGVSKISLGYIEAGLPPAKGLVTVKIRIDGHSILISVRDSTAHQTIRVYGTNLSKIAEEITKKAKEIGLRVFSFSEPH